MNIQLQKNIPLNSGRLAVVLALAALFQLAIADPSLAQSSGQAGSAAFSPVLNATNAIVTFITGPFGRSLAIIAVIGLGFLAFAGRLSWFTAGAVILGIGLVFGAPTIVDELTNVVKQ